MTPEIQTAKPRKRRNAKTSTSATPKKLATTIHLSPEAVQRLGVHALMSGMDRSAYVESLILEHCRRFVVADRAKSSNEVIGSTADAA